MDLAFAKKIEGQIGDVVRLDEKHKFGGKLDFTYEGKNVSGNLKASHVSQSFHVG
jgi:hypothetical protein